MQFDLIVMGGGIAGMTAANRAAQLGLSVCVLEAGSAEKYPCNTRFTGGTFHVCKQDIMSGEAALRAHLTSEVGDIAGTDVIDAVAKDAPRVIAWLREEGMRFMRASASAYHSHVLAPPGRSRPGLDWEGRSGDVLLMTLEKNFRKRGGKMVRGARVVELLCEGESVVGVQAETAEGPKRFGSSAIVICDGGFQGDHEAVQRNVSPHPEHLRQRGAGTGKGDGLRLAVEAGAATSDLTAFYGHLLSMDALTNDNLWPYPYMDALVAVGVLVTRDGRRFADESLGGVAMANAVARLPDPSSAFLVFDAAAWNGAGKAGLIPVNPHLVNEGGTIHSADTVAAVAAKAGIDAEALAVTLADSKSVTKAPFYVVPVCAGITYTMGGILTDADGRVCKSGGGAVEGLYAAGATVGGMEGGPRIGYVGGLARSAIFGLRVAESVAEQKASSTGAPA